MIRTTGEHPFYVVGKGWTDACLLQPGDLLCSRDGSTVAVQECCDTGEYETVYNCRVAEYHTYFVGDATWPFSVWAHNECRIAPDPNAQGPHTVIRRNPQTGQIIRYATYIPQTNPRNPAKWQLVKRVDLVGDEHFNKVLKQYIPVPHVHDPSFPGGIRPALP